MTLNLVPETAVGPDNVVYDKPVDKYAILSAYRGSHAHGTNIDPLDNEEFGTDDIDLMTVVVMPPRYYTGLDTYGHGRGTKNTMDGPWDVVAYDIRKFMALCRKGNPNVLTLLWHNHPNYDVFHATGRVLCSPPVRERLTHTRATITAHMGYAQEQLRQMSKDPTSRAYMGERRKALAARYGYDTKHASHMIRIMRMLIGVMTSGVLSVDRSLHDAEELVAIKCGEWTLEQVMAEMEELLGRARILEESSTWPDRVDEDWLSKLTSELIWQEWQDRLAGNGNVDWRSKA